MRQLSLMFMFAFALVSMSDAAFSQSRRGSDGEQDACRGDARRHCRKVLDQGDMAVFNCLSENKSRLSRACRKVVEQNGG
jgi:hypothetical protein